jgi:hypothetical protein
MPMLELVMAAALMRPAAENEVRDRMIDLYDQVCLQAFPDDSAIEKAMTGLGATELTKAEVEIYLHDDPGRGWRFASTGMSFTVTVEAPPYHACAVRATMAEPFADLGAYPAIVSAFQKAHGGGFQTMQPMEMDIGPVHSRATGEQKVIGRGGESLFYFVNTPTQRAIDGGTPPSAELRFVHQIMK